MEEKEDNVEWWVPVIGIPLLAILCFAALWGGSWLAYFFFTVLPQPGFN